MSPEKAAAKSSGVVFGIMASIGGVIGIWAMATVMGGLSSVGWQPAEMCRQFLIATGNLQEYETMVDFYTHIKGVEYLIAVAFFAVFPVFYKSLKPKEARVTSK